jgi:hypothetical protein
MEMFDTHRRDILNFDNYMDLKKPGFGGPASAMALRDGKGKIVNTKPKLAGFQRTVERDPAFSHPVYDPTYKAMTGDLVYKQEGKKAFTYDDQRTGIPVVQMDPLKEGKAYSSFQRFINESEEDEDEEYFETPEELENTDELEDEEYAYPNLGDDEDESEYRAEATRSNNTMSDLRQIEDKLRSFEEGGDFGANPMVNPFEEPIPDWVEKLGSPDLEDPENLEGEEY